MAERTYCDRCGKHIKTFDSLIFDKYSTLSFLTIPHQDKLLHLCKKCTKDFEKFMKNKNGIK